MVKICHFIHLKIYNTVNMESGYSLKQCNGILFDYNYWFVRHCNDAAGATGANLK